MVTTDEQAFLRQICDCPEDDVVRLVFADWLEENGEPKYAAFIRENVEDGRDWSVARFGPFSKRLVFEKGRLRVPEHLPPGTRWTVSRGFASSIEISPEAFLRYAGELIRDYPITRVALQGLHPGQFYNTGEFFWTSETLSATGSGYSAPYLVPDVLFRLMGEPRFTPTPAHCYQTEREARDALSLVCLAYGRAEAAKLT